MDFWMSRKCVQFVIPPAETSFFEAALFQLDILIIFFCVINLNAFQEVERQPYLMGWQV